MLQEYKFVNTPGVSTQDVLKSWVFYWKCPKCEEELVVNEGNIEDYTDSDPHNPLQDYFICPECGRSYGLFNGIEGKVNNDHAKIWADGSFIYLSTDKEDRRIV